MFVHRHFADRVFLCSAEPGELELGPGGTPTPTPEPGPTPTPQPEPEVVAKEDDKGLKPLAELLGKKEGEAPGPDATSKPSPDSAKARITTLVIEKNSEKRARESAEARAKLAEDTIAELQKLSAKAPVEGDGGAPAKPAARTFTQADVEAEAARLAARTTFNRRVDDAVIAGRKAHADYDEAISAFKQVTGPVVPGDFLAAALETGEASELIYHLGKNPGEADRILSLPPIAQPVALANLAHEIKATKVAAAEAEPTVSKAPKPITPRVGGRAAAEPDLETMPMADFIAKRNEQERAARTKH